MENDFVAHNTASGGLRLLYSQRTDRLRLCIIGHGRSGKDTAAEILGKLYGMKFSSSSMAAAKIFIYDELKTQYGYENFEECYSDRHNRRAEWFRLICNYNADDPARLAKAIMSENDIYVGMRSRREIEACKKAGLFDLVIWVDAGLRVPEEGADSFDIGLDAADIVIDNNGTEVQFYHRIKRLGAVLSGELFGVKI